MFIELNINLLTISNILHHTAITATFLFCMLLLLELFFFVFGKTEI